MIKTPESNGNPSVAITLSCNEALALISALNHYKATHRTGLKKPNDGKWGHFDCPPRVQDLINALYQAIQSQHPLIWELQVLQVLR